MKPCIECKKEISTDADTCPLCGKRNPHGLSAIVKFGGGFLVLVIGFVIVGSIAAAFKDSEPSPAMAAVQPTPAGGVQAGSVQEEAPAAEPEDSLPIISDGVYEVGTEIQPGIYRVGQYWERQDKHQNTLANDLSRGCPTLVLVRPTDAYLVVKGGAVSADITTVNPIEKECTAGTFLVGKDIAPGRYKLKPAGRMAYWERMNKRLETIANDIGEGQRILIVRESDFAIKINDAILEPM